MIIRTLALCLTLCACSNSNLVDSETSQSQLSGKWQLVELSGQKVTLDVPPHLVFNDDGKVSGFAGCNRLFGGAEIGQGMQIRFSNLATTMMACPQLTLEGQFMQMLEKVDNYSLSGDSLSLNKARMAPLARFKRLKE
ncbi:META domain-containing protein [Bowmanella denitrificans]|uniref:META domain-containing protein n=1 Tax=Bowmanella denitrificans TaxID=366582 RepID=UPI000C9B10D5|nr:META domain-containing protein [Bowmanella denitrificans]